MHLSTRLKADNFHRAAQNAFTLVEVLVAIVVVVLFGAAAFATNQRLLLALKGQKETTAATMVMQQRMESYRAASFSNLATASYVQASIVATPTGSEGPLGALTEQVTVGVYPDDGSTDTVIQRNSTYPTGNIVSAISLPLSSSVKLLRIDELLSWTSADGRARSRQLSTIVGIGNTAP
jgi:prepilin-type N-terminal cleavage/methylation domain-containing protein